MTESTKVKLPSGCFQTLAVMLTLFLALLHITGVANLEVWVVVLPLFVLATAWFVLLAAMSLLLIIVGIIKVFDERF